MPDDLFLPRHTLFEGRDFSYAVVRCPCDGGYRMATIYLYEIFV